MVEAGGGDFLQHDAVAVPQQFDPFRGYFADDADGQAGAGERLAADNFVGQAQLPAYGAHFVLEQVAQGLDQGEVHPRRQAAHIVMRLDARRGPVLRRFALNHIGIQGALRQPLYIVQFGGGILKDADKLPADGLALDFRVGDAGQAVEEPLRRVDIA